MIDVHAAGADDVELLALIHAEAFVDPWSGAEIGTLMAGLGAFPLLARLDDAPAGFILCRVAADEAEVLTLATRPAMRRRGVASSLLDAARLVCGAEAKVLFLEVAEDNPAALALYRSKGFREVGRRSAYYRRAGGPVAALILRLELNT